MVARPFSLTPGTVVKDAYYKQTQQGSTTTTGVSGGMYKIYFPIGKIEHH
jgi:hypothetical protein